MLVGEDDVDEKGLCRWEKMMLVGEDDVGVLVGRDDVGGRQ